MPELEALLPAKVGDVELERLSLPRRGLLRARDPDTQSQLDAMLTALGKTVADLAVADAGDPSGRTVLEIGAFRVAGAKPAQLLSEWVSSNQASNPGNITVSNETVDGRRLTKLVDRSPGRRWDDAGLRQGRHHLPDRRRRPGARLGGAGPAADSLTAGRGAA